MSPVREAKSRTLSREYMADRQFMTEYTAPEREWYLLTALFADDAGYLFWDLPDNAANLYRYESPAKREKRVSGMVEHFTASGRFRDLGCGHAFMPSVGKHPRGSSREYAVRDEHQHCTATAPEVQSSASPSVPLLASPLLTVPPAGEGENGSSEPTTTKRNGKEEVRGWTSTRGVVAALGFGVKEEATQ